MTKLINYERCRAAMENIYVNGLCNSSARKDVIESAIKAIGEDGASALSQRYIGTKDYAHWKDQEISCEYGYGPKHGHVVFSVGRSRRQGCVKTLGDDEIYFLLACRDFNGFEVGNGKSSLTLPQVVSAVAAAKADLFLKGSVFEDVSPVISKGDLIKSISELKACGFECEAGPIDQAQPFLHLEALANK